MRKAAWVSLPRIYRENMEKYLEKLLDIGIDETYVIVSQGSGAIFPSKVKPQIEEFRGKDPLKEYIGICRRLGIKIYTWIVSLNLPNNEFIEKHRDLYVVNKLGISCIDNPPYVPYYKWLCPSRDEVKTFLTQHFLEIAENYDVDGLHFDYIRLPDILLPRGIRSRYEGVPLEDKILPQYDFCYCNVCREKYMEERGIDPIKLDYSDEEYSRWFKWRADRITDIVKNVYKSVKNFDSSLEISAAVFATPSLAYKYVFQEWPKWGLDLYNPMIYHKYYNENVDWIGTAVKEGVKEGVKISAGILVGFMESREEMYRGFKAAIDNGAIGVTIFVYPPPRPELCDWIKYSLKKLD